MLKHEDFFESVKNIPKNLYDLVIADPPYANISTSMGNRVLVTDYMVMKPFFDIFFKETEQITKKCASMFVFCDWRTYPLIWLASSSSSWKLTNMIVWDYNWIKAGYGFRFTHELIAYFTKPDTKSPSNRSISDVWRFKPMNFTNNSRLLETQKPLDLILYIVDNAPRPVQKVLDPFTGTGTVPIACNFRGVDCDAFEINPVNYEIAKKRIENDTKQGQIPFSSKLGD